MEKDFFFTIVKILLILNCLKFSNCQNFGAYNCCFFHFFSYFILLIIFFCWRAIFEICFDFLSDFLKYFLFSYQGYYITHKITKIKKKQHKHFLFSTKSKQSPQELEVGLRNGPFFPVLEYNFSYSCLFLWIKKYIHGTHRYCRYCILIYQGCWINRWLI